MKRRLRLVITIAVYLCIPVSFVSAGCRAMIETTPPAASGPGTTIVTVTPYPDNPEDKIPFTINPCTDDPEGKIIVDDIAVTSGILEGKQPYSPLHGKFKAGDPCFLVSGRIINNYSEGSYVTHHAHGYDAAGNEVAFTLDEGPISGVEQVYIEPDSSETFLLHLSWSYNVTSMEISFQRASQMFP